MRTNNEQGAKYMALPQKLQGVLSQIPVSDWSIRRYQKMTKSTKTKPLSARRLRFCQNYISADTDKEAAIAAGYSEKSAHVAAARLLKDDNVLDEIARRQEEASKRADIREDDVIEMLVQVRDEAREAKQFGPCVRAIELIGKKMGMFIDKHLVGNASEHTDEEMAAGLARATAGKDPVLARVLFRNALARIPPNTFDPRPELSDDEIDALISGATVH